MPIEREQIYELARKSGIFVEAITPRIWGNNFTLLTRAWIEGEFTRKVKQVLPQRGLNGEFVPDEKVCMDYALAGVELVKEMVRLDPQFPEGVRPVVGVFPFRRIIPPNHAVMFFVVAGKDNKPEWIYYEIMQLICKIVKLKPEEKGASLGWLLA